MKRIVVSVKMATAGLLTSLVQLCYSCPNMNLVHRTFSTQRSVHTTQASLSMPSPRQIQMSGFSQGLFGWAPAPCKMGGAGAGAGGAGFYDFTGSTSLQAKPLLYLLTCYSMEPLHFLSV